MDLFLLCNVNDSAAKLKTWQCNSHSTHIGISTFILTHTDRVLSRHTHSAHIVISAFTLYLHHCRCICILLTSLLILYSLSCYHYSYNYHYTLPTSFFSYSSSTHIANYAFILNSHRYLQVQSWPSLDLYPTHSAHIVTGAISTLFIFHWYYII